MTAKTGAREDGGWRRNAAQVREWSRPARKKDWEGKVGVGGGVGCGRDGFGGGVDNFVVQQQRTGTRGLPTGQGVWRKSGILGGTTGETAQRLPHAIRGQAARPAQQVCRRRDEGVGSPHPHPLPSPPPSPFPLPLIQVPLGLSSLHPPLQSNIPPYVDGWTCLSDSGWTTTYMQTRQPLT